MTTLAPPPARSVRLDASGVADRVRSLPGLARRHSVFLVVLAIGAVLRALAEIAYPNAFYFPDSRGYVLNSLQWTPNYLRPFGYALFLKPFVPGSFGAVALAQHLLGLALAVSGYAFLVRRGVTRWIAAVAMLPVLLDARQVTIEHNVSAETLFIVLVGAALIVAAWRDRVGVPAAVASGLLLGAAALTRSVGMPLAALVVVYLLVRRVGWRPLVGFVLAVGIMLGGYLAWYHHSHGVYAFNQYQGRFLQARMLSIADCDRITLTAKQRTLCPDTPPSKRLQRPDGYIWSDNAPARRLYPHLSDDPFLDEFAMTVLRQQPGDYVAMVLRETSWHFMFKPPVEEHGRCILGTGLLPKSPNGLCQATLYQVRGITDQPSGGPQRPSAVSTALHRYSTPAQLPGPLLALGILVTLFAAVWRPRRAGWRTAADGLLFAGAGLGLIVISVATSMYEMRYMLPALFLIPLGAALAVHRIWTVRRRPAPVPADASAQPS
jgi:hypothetical protein